MTYRVIYAPSFRDDITQHIDYLIAEKTSSETIQRWYNKLFLLMDSLASMPRRYAVDPDYSDGSGHETRKVNFGNYVVFYEVDEGAKVVNVVGFMHGARRREG